MTSEPNKEILVKGSLGTILPIAAALTASQFESWLRIISLCVGIAVGVATFVVIVKRRKP